MAEVEIDEESQQPEPQQLQGVKIPWSTIGMKGRDGLFGLVAILATITAFARSDYNAPLFFFLYKSFKQLQAPPNKRLRQFFLALVVFSIAYDLVWWCIQASDPIGPSGLIAENLASLSLIVVWFVILFKIGALVIIRQTSGESTSTHGPAPPGFYY